MANIGEARMYGYELSFEADASSHIIFESTLSYVRGEDTKDHSNLPQISPLRGTFSADYIFDKYGTVNAQLEGVTGQDFAAAGETQTAGYVLIDAGYKSVPIPLGATSMTLDCGVQNVLNRAYMNFLSTARGEIKYEPGRNVFATASIKL
jgi:outer membrane receptor protein involved in Fe transport